MGFRFVFAVAVLVCVLFAPGAPASAPQSVFENEITVTATGSEDAVDDVPVAVTVIGREEIDDSQEESVADLLRRVPGVTIIRSGDEGTAMSTFVRGTESDHALALFDGVRLNSPYFAGYDWSLLPTTGIDRIEIVRGPFSALWGADAIGGAVNVVPARAHDGLNASLVAEGGEDSWGRFEGAIGWAGSGFDIYASGFDRQGEGTLDNSDFENSQMLVDTGYSWAEGSRVALLVQGLDSEIGIPFADPVTLTPNRRQEADQLLIAVPLRFRVSDRWNLELVASQVERELSYSDPDDPWGFTWSETAADTVQARLASRHQLGDHGLTWGAEWREDEVSNESTYGVNLDGDTSTVSSLFVQDFWRLDDSFRLIAGARWDDADEWGSEVSPRISLGWDVTSAVELRASYGKAFRQPSVAELYYPFSGNPDLEAEQSDSFELGVVGFIGATRLQANLFSTEVDDLIDFDYVTYAYANVAEAEMQGLEVAWDAPLFDDLMSLLQITWLDTEDDRGEELLRRPEWGGSWTLTGALWGTLRGDLALIWVGSRPDIDPITFETFRLGSHVTGNLSLSFEILQGLDVTLRAQNLADKDYQEVAGYPAPGRRFTGGLRWSL